MVPASLDEMSELLQAAARADQVAFAELYRLSSGRLYAVARRVLRDSDRAGDALQEAYVRIWTHAARFDPARGKAIAWMVTILRRVAIDMVRQSAASPEQGMDLSEMEIPVPPHGGDAMDLARCLDGLDAVQARAIRLAMQFGLSHSELAEALNQPLGTLKSTIRRGLMKLRGCLEGVPAHA